MTCPDCTVGLFLTVCYEGWTVIDTIRPPFNQTQIYDRTLVVQGGEAGEIHNIHHLSQININPARFHLFPVKRVNGHCHFVAERDGIIEFTPELFQLCPYNPIALTEDLLREEWDRLVLLGLTFHREEYQF